MPAREERIAIDGGAMPGYLALPDRRPAPALVLYPEIFGANAHMRGRADELAGLGYATLLVDVFWRTSPGFALDEAEPDAMQRAMPALQALDGDRAAADGAVALTHLRALPEIGAAGVFGFCLGGMLAYLTAAAADPAVAVCYYPSGAHERLDRAALIRCPALFQFGGADQFLPADLPERMKAATAHNPRVEIHVHPGADHAFDNERFMLHHPRARATAADQTIAFLRRELPISE